MHTTSEHLYTITDAAKALHIHPNTLRKWADAGKIETVRLPSSGYRRFRADVIARMRVDMGIDAPSSNTDTEAA